MTLVEFREARLAEDEAVARAAARIPDRASVPADVRIISDSPATVPPDHDAARHIARHDPARVLREVEAKRRIIGASLSSEVKDVPSLVALEPPSAVGARTPLDLVYPSARATLRALASVYSDHEAYDPGWAL